MAKVGAEGAGVTDFEERDYQAAWSDLSHQAFGEGGLMEQRDSARSEARQLRTENERWRADIEMWHQHYARELVEAHGEIERLRVELRGFICEECLKPLGQPKDGQELR